MSAESTLQFLTTQWFTHARTTHVLENGLKAAEMPKGIYTGAVVAQPQER